jgi:gamma-glutamyltranspeptidase/glutathione hydrolase
MRPLIVAFSLALALAAAPAVPAQAETPAAKTDAQTGRGMVVAANPHATEAGVEILRQGGSAVDAAIAVEAMLGLVEPQSSGLGAGGFLAYYDAKTHAVSVYDGRETAPAGATPTMFLRPDGSPMGYIEAKNSGRSIGAPGVVDALALAHADHGALPWAKLFEPAKRAASQGFAVSPRLNALITQAANIGLKANPDTEHYFYTPQDEPLPVGFILKNPAYADTLDKIAANPRAIYEGPIAAAIAAAAQAGDNGGTLSVEDLAKYHARRLPAVCAPYRAYTVCGPPPPSAGGVMVNQALGVLSHFQFSADGAKDPHNWALFAEALRLAYADWGQHMGDDRFVAVPVRGLLSPEYLAARAALISPDHAMDKVSPGDPWPYQGGKPSRFGADATQDQHGTSHFVVVDKAGNVVSMTASVEGPFGSTRMAAGMILNNQLTDFSFRPVDATGVPAANAVAAGKAPRSSMSPTIVLGGDGQFVLATGSPGGASIIAYVAKTLVGVLDWGLTPQQAVELPNLVAGGPVVRLEQSRASPELIEGLRAFGFNVQASGGEASGLHMVLRHADGTLEAGVDPRREGAAGTP